MGYMVVSVSVMVKEVIDQDGLLQGDDDVVSQGLQGA